MKIYVGNLSYDVTEEELQQEFTAYGEVTSVSILTDKFTGRSKGFGFVEMASTDEDEAAITAINGKTLRHRTIDAIQVLPLSDNGGNGSCSHKRGGWPSSRVRQRR